MGGGASRNQNITQTQRIPPEMRPFLVGEDGILPRVDELSKMPLTLPGFEVADRTGAQDLASQLAQGGVGSYLPALMAGFDVTGQGLDSMMEGMGLTRAAPGMAQPFTNMGLANMLGGAGLTGASIGSFDPMSYGSFMDPFQEEVIRRAEQDIFRQGQMQQQDLRSNAVSSGAFGGSRAAVAERELGRNVADQQARTTSQLRSQGFGDAMSRAMSAFDSQMSRLAGAGGQLAQIGQGVAGVGQQQANLTMGAGQQMGVLGQGIGGLGQQMAGMGAQGQQMGLQDINTLLTVGGQEQAQQQAVLDAQRQTESQNVMMPFQQLGFLSDVFSGSPTGMSTMLQQPGPSLASQVLGMGTGLMSLSQLQQGRGV